MIEDALLDGATVVLPTGRLALTAAKSMVDIPMKWLGYTNGQLLDCAPGFAATTLPGPHSEQAS